MTHPGRRHDAPGPRSYGEQPSNFVSSAVEPEFSTVFDATREADQLSSAYGFYGLFIAAGVTLIGICVIRTVLRHKPDWFLIAFTAVWSAVVAYGLATDAEDVHDIRERVRRGAFDTVEGCLSYFHPGSRHASKSTEGNERWAVNGAAFSYGAGDIRPGYRVVEPLGGAVHPSTRVRVSFVRSPHYDRLEIVRLEVAQGACPAAPDTRP